MLARARVVLARLSPALIAELKRSEQPFRPAGRSSRSRCAKARSSAPFGTSCRRSAGSHPSNLRLIQGQVDALEAKRRAGQRVDIADLYEGLVDDWRHRDDPKHHLEREHKLILMERLAHRLWANEHRDTAACIKGLAGLRAAYRPCARELALADCLHVHRHDLADAAPPSLFRIGADASAEAASPGAVIGHQASVRNVIGPQSRLRSEWPLARLGR